MSLSTFYYFQYSTNNTSTYSKQGSIIKATINNNQSINNNNYNVLINDMIQWSIKPNSFCFLNEKLKSSNTAIVTVSDVTGLIIDDLLELSRLNKLNYCVKYNYVYCELPVNVEIGKHPIYAKIAAIMNVLKLHKYTIWMDIDIVTKDNTRSFEEFISLLRKNESLYALFTSDVHEPIPKIHQRKTNKTNKKNKGQPPSYWGINSGIMIYKSHNMTFNFLEEQHSYFTNEEHCNEHVQVVDYHNIELFKKDVEQGQGRAKKLIPQRKNDTHLFHLAGGHWKAAWTEKQKLLRKYLAEYTDINK